MAELNVHVAAHGQTREKYIVVMLEERKDTLLENS